ncbi:MAG: hemolysin family protein [Acidimicrobiales bacterium]|nr:hemolysin family protein [Acidimicrobiales bacterium]
MTVGNLALALVLLLANGFFVAVEFALMASRRTKLEAMADHGSARARLAIGSMRHLNVQLAGAQLGITMASLLLGYVAEPTVADLVERAVEVVVNVPEGVLHTIGFAIALTIVAFLHMVIGEMVPKNIALAAPERTLLSLAVPNRVYVTVFGPLLRILNGLSNAGVRLLGVEPRDELATAASAQELAVMLGASRDEGLIEDVAHQLLTGALHLRDRRVTTVMMPRDGVVWLPRSATPAEAEALVVSSGHTRLLVAGESVDDVLGFVHAKDLLTVAGEARHRPLPLGRVRRMLLVGEDTLLDDALLAMQRARIHVAVVTDPAGRTLGIVTLEDVIEALVGDIRDESDR